MYRDIAIELLPTPGETTYVAAFPRASGSPLENLRRDREIMGSALRAAGVSSALMGEASLFGTRWTFSLPSGFALTQEELERLIIQARVARKEQPLFRLRSLNAEHNLSASIVIRPVAEHEPGLMDWTRRLVSELEGLDAIAAAAIEGDAKPTVEISADPFRSEPSFALGQELGFLARDLGAPPGATSAAGQSIRWEPASAEFSGFRVNPRIDTQSQGVWLDGRPATVVSLWRNAAFSDADVSSGLRRVLRQERDPRFQTTVAFESSRYIEEAESNVLSNLFLGTALTCLCILFFVRYFWATSLVSLSIPLALILTIPILYALGLTRNVMSLAGAALGVGIVVDATFGTISTFNQRLRLGYLPHLCALHSARDNEVPLLLTCLSNLAVFTPILLLDGVVGSLFWDLSVTVIVGQAVGFVVSVYLMPGIACLLHEKRESHLSVTRQQRRPEGSFKDGPSSQERVRVTAPGAETSVHGSSGSPLQEWLGQFLSRPRLMFALQVSLLLGLALLAWQAPPSEFLPAADSKEFSAVVRFSGPPTETEVRDVRNKLEAFLAREGFEKRLIRASENGLVASAEHHKNPHIVNLSREIERIMAPRAAGVYRINPLEPRSRFGDDIEIFFPKTSDPAALRRFDDALRAEPGVVSTRASWNEEFREARAPSERALLYAAGVPLSATTDIQKLTSEVSFLGFLSEHWVRPLVVDTPWLERGFGSRPGSAGYERGAPPLVHLPQQADAYALAPGQLLPRELVAAGTTFQTGAAAVYDVNGAEHHRFSIDVDGVPSGVIETRIKALARTLGLRMEWHPSTAENQTGFRNLVICLASAVAIIALIIYAQTRSISLSVVVLGTFLWGPLGSIPGLMLHGEALSASALVGFILLAGTIVNNGILLVEQIVRNRKAQMAPVEACVEAVKTRSVPVVVTSLTTILGTLPLVFETGAGSQMYRGLAIVLVYGTAVSTPVSLLGVPSLVLLLGMAREWGNRSGLRTLIVGAALLMKSASVMAPSRLRGVRGP